MSLNMSTQKSKPTEAEKYQAIVLSHPIEATTVTENERRKERTKLQSNPTKSQEFKIRTQSMVKKDW